MGIAVDSYIVETKNSKECMAKICKHLTGKIGMVVAREPEADVKKNLKNQKIDTIWLTEIQTSAKHMSPKQIEQLVFTIEQSITEKKVSFVLLTGIEYIISYTSFKEVLHLVQHIKDVALVNKITFLVNVGTDTMEQKEKSLLMQELVNYNAEYK